MREILYIIINHSHGELVKEAIRSINNLPYDINSDLLLINNLPDQKLVLWLNSNFPKTIIVNNKRAIGFSENINNGVNKQGSNFKYYCLINPDVECHSNVINKLKKYMDSNEDVGIAGPMLYNTDGTIQSSCRRFPTPLASIGRALRLDLIINNLYSNYLMGDFDHNKTIDVDWLTGAFMMIRAKALREIGMFDSTNFFLYCEDIDICKRMWKNKWKISYHPDATSTHHFIRAGATNPLSINFFYQVKSTINYYKKYGIRYISHSSLIS